jgi:hypothetical protein
VSLTDDDLRLLRDAAARSGQSYALTVRFQSYVTPAAVVALVEEVERARAASAAEGK